MLDFLFLYEHRAREIETCVYLSEALKRKGYKCKVCNMLSFEKKGLKPKVIIVPHLYDNEQVRLYTSSIWRKRKTKIIDMQYEQVLSVIDRITAIHEPKGEARRAFHVAWGENETMEYLKNGIAKEQILRNGSLPIDFNSSQYRRYLYTKDQLSNEYQINGAKKWCLFLSSFAYCGRSDDDLNKLQNSKDALRLRSIMEPSKKEILSWFRKLIETNDDIVVIYRRHPAETIDHSLIELEEKYRNSFILNAEKSIQHWINACDNCLTWFSTSSIDAYYSQKPCGILRPYPLDFDYELETLYHSKTITTFDELSKFIQVGGDDNNSLIKKDICRFFDNEIDKLVIDKYIDSFQYVLKCDNSERFFYSSKDSLRDRTVEFILGIMCDFSKYCRISPIVGFFNKKVGKVVKYYEKESFGINRDIRGYKKRINQFLNEKGKISDKTLILKEQ